MFPEHVYLYQNECHIGCHGSTRLGIQSNLGNSRKALWREEHPYCDKKRNYTINSKVRRVRKCFKYIHNSTYHEQDGSKKEHILKLGVETFQVVLEVKNPMEEI